MANAPEMHTPRKETHPMTDRRIKVWLQPCKDRPYPRLQWIDPVTGQRKSRSAGTANPQALETARANLETRLNNALEQRLLKKRCDQCGKTLERKRTNARFCSPKCRAYWHRWNQRRGAQITPQPEFPEERQR
jgi:hypothetical protein